VVRGEPVAVIDLATLLHCDQSSSASGRFVTIHVEGRRFALAVDRVVGLAEIPPALLGELPSLLHNAETGLIELLGTRDAQLLFVLLAAQIIPEDVWATLVQEMSAT
jgi:chemotaxis signal transduction protein